jgi:hypothetical protein
VDVALVVVRWVEVDHVGDPVQVEAAGRDVRGHQRVDLPRLEPGQGPLPGGLREVSVQRLGRHAPGHEPAGQPVGPPLGADEHQGETAVAGQQLHERVHLPVGVHGEEAMVGLRHRGGLGGHLVEARGARVGPGQPAHLAVQRGRGEDRLPAPWQATDDPVHLGLEPHVEHPVRLVEDEDPHPSEVDQAAGREVLEPARRGHDDVGQGRGPGLLPERHPAVRDGRPEPPPAEDRRQLLPHLDGQLPGRDEHERGGRRILP